MKVNSVDKIYYSLQSFKYPRSSLRRTVSQIDCAGRKRKHERSEYLLFLAQSRQNQKQHEVLRHTRSGWILELGIAKIRVVVKYGKCEARHTRSGWILEGDEKDKQDMIWFFNRGSTSVEQGERRVHRVNDLSRLNRGIEKLR